MGIIPIVVGCWDACLSSAAALGLGGLVWGRPDDVLPPWVTWGTASRERRVLLSSAAAIGLGWVGLGPPRRPAAAVGEVGDCLARAPRSLVAGCGKVDRWVWFGAAPTTCCRRRGGGGLPRASARPDWHWWACGFRFGSGRARGRGHRGSAMSAPPDPPPRQRVSAGFVSLPADSGLGLGIPGADLWRLGHVGAVRPTVPRVGSVPRTQNSDSQLGPAAGYRATHDSS
jgi:hypothetical protein